jgi:small subunit ribosomal protein S3
MGQKTHPEGFRLVTTSSHLSKWYANKSLYSQFLEEDFFIRTKIQTTFEPYLSISRIKIERVLEQVENALEVHSIEHIHIKVIALFPRGKTMAREIRNYFETPIEVEKESLGPKSFERGMKLSTNLILKERVRKLLSFLTKTTKKAYTLSVVYIKNPFEDTVLIAKYIAEQLKRRIPFRRVIKQAIKKAQVTSNKGIKIEVSGRLNGAEIARSEWKREGQIPLHTLNAHIDYTHHHVETVYGLIGIKVWLFIG